MPTISVTGTAEIFVVPDEVIFSLEVEKTNKDLQIAKRENDESIGQILALTKRFEIAPKDVKTDYISVSKQYEFIGTGPERRRVFTGFAVSKTVIVKLKDLSKFESFFSEVLKTGVSEIKSVSFGTSESRKYKDEARTKAMIAAREKAQAMAGAIGQSIGKAVQISEQTSRVFNAYSNITANTVSDSDISGRGSDTFSAGTLSIKLSVEVKFLLN
jgi:uncharacterized protein YggE